MIFPTKEKDIKLLMVIYKGLRGVDRRSIKMEAWVHYESNRLVLSVNVDRQKSTKKDISAFLKGEIKKTDIQISYAEINGEEIKLQFCDNNIRFLSGHLEGTKCIISAELNKVSYTSNNENVNRFRLSATANDLQSYLNTLDTEQWHMEMCPRQIDYQGKKYILLHDTNRVWIETRENNIEDLLTLISFFYAVPVECDIQVVNGVTTIQKIEWNLGEGKWQNMALSQLYTESKCYSIFWEYITLVNREMHITEQTRNYIQEFVRSQQLDCESKLHIYCAILARMAKVQKTDDSYAIIKTFLVDKHHIEAKKLDGDLLEKKIKKNKTEIVTNFYDLRSFFEHQLGSNEARKFLKESLILERLEVAINIVILHQLGANDVRFDSRFKNNSVFDDSVPYGHVYERLFNMT